MGVGRVGEQIVIHGRVVGHRERVAVIVAVRGPEGPYQVRFPDGTVTVLFPGPDAEFRPVPDSP
jgi:hypothetical protein